jgi:hypothetical protein
MENLGIYKHKSTTFVIGKLSSVVAKLRSKNANHILNAQAKSLLKELKFRKLTPAQKQEYFKLLDRYIWI